MEYYEMTAKNICCLYFSGAQKRHADLDKLYEFCSHLAKNLRNELKDTSINFLYSNYYLDQMCCDYDNLFEMDEEQLSLKKGIYPEQMQKELGWMNIDVLIPCLDITEDYFGKEKTEKHNTSQRPIKREANERTI